MQAQILIPLATSIIFGIATSTLLVIFVIPCLYCVLEDFGVAKANEPDTKYNQHASHTKKITT